MHTILYGKEEIPYELCWSNRRKTLGIAVQGNRVLVTAPTGTCKDLIANHLCKKAPWIRKQLQEYKEINPFMEEREFVSGEKLPYLGRYYRLKVMTNDSVESICFKFFQGKFIAVVPSSLPESQYREELYPLYKKWIITRATTFVQERSDRFCTKIGDQPTTIQIKEQNQRWGSCTPDGKIYLNWRIFLAPTSIVDYVLVHELAHLKNMDHSTAFWNTIKMVLPNYEEKKEWLRINGRKFYI